MLQSGSALKKYIGVVALEFLFAAIVVWFFDPFYQYHEPIGNRPAVLSDSTNQVAGTIRSFDYDSVLVGTSVAENCDTDFLNHAYDARFIKVIRQGGSTADLIYYLNMVHANRQLKNVIYCLDISSLMADTQTVLLKEENPRYLFTDTMLDDGTYLFNKEVIFKRIPFMLAGERMGRNVGGKAYDWSEGKEFSAQNAMRAYEKPTTRLEAQNFEQDIVCISENIAMLEREVESNPDTTYRFFLPTYSMMWWDCAVANGVQEEYYYCLEQVLKALTVYSNVEVYDFQVWVDCACDLDNYMDMIHYSPQVNAWMLEAMSQGENVVESDSVEDFVLQTRDMVQSIVDDKIYIYYEK